MANTWVTDLRDFLDSDGRIPQTLPGPARALAEHLVSIAVAACESSPTGSPPPAIRCRRRPGHRRCSGLVEYGIGPGTRVAWACPRCGDNGPISSCHLVRGRRGRPETGPRRAGPLQFTPLQGQYLAFIRAYTVVNGRAPAEIDMQRFFGVTPPSVHQMVLALERRGLVSRQPGASRSLLVLVPAEQLPVLLGKSARPATTE